MNKLQLARKCWWCSQRLMKISHAEIKDQLGNTVWVHKCCEADARKAVKPLTAQENQS